MEAARVVCGVFFYLKTATLGLSEGKQSDFKRERICGYLPGACLNFLLGGSRGECSSSSMRKSVKR